MCSQGKFAVNVERRRWDVQEYERKAVEEARKKAAENGQTRRQRPRQHSNSACHVTPRRQSLLSACFLSFFLSLDCLRLCCTDAPVTTKAPLRAREVTPLNLSATLGKSVLVAANTPLSARGGYYCDVCTCLLKDSQTYLDHINGKKHQKKLGMTMKVAKVDVEDVRDRVRQWAEKAEGEKQGSKGREAGRKRRREDGDERDGVLEESKQHGEEDVSEADDDEASGGGSGSTGERTESVKEESSGDVAATILTTARPAELDRTADEEEESMMAAMGFNFSAFGGSKKA